MIPGYVMFRLGQRTFALSLDEVHEIVRLAGLEPLPGTRPPMAGVIVLRGNPLPVLDVRSAGAGEDEGDVLVMDVAGDPVGVAVDEVLAVLAAADLPESGKRPPRRCRPTSSVSAETATVPCCWSICGGCSTVARPAGPSR